jgi:hypothetical protein
LKDWAIVNAGKEVRYPMPTKKPAAKKPVSKKKK